MELVDNDEKKFFENEFIYSALHGHYESVKLILAEKKIDINAEDVHGNTALMMASIGGEKGYVNIVNLLIDYHADVNAQNNVGYTALMGAILNGHIEIVYALLEVNAIDIDIVNNDGHTAAEIARDHGHHEISHKLRLESVRRGDRRREYERMMREAEVGEEYW
jgi:ankyrin repeat protein